MDKATEEQRGGRGIELQGTSPAHRPAPWFAIAEQEMLGTVKGERPKREGVETQGLRSWSILQLRAVTQLWIGVNAL